MILIDALSGNLLPLPYIYIYTHTNVCIYIYIYIYPLNGDVMDSNGIFREFASGTPRFSIGKSSIHGAMVFIATLDYERVAGL